MKLKKLLLFSLSLVFALSLTFGLGGAFKAFAANGETGPKLFTGARVTLTEDIVTKFEYTAPAGYTSASYTFTYRGETTEAKTATVNEGENTIEFAEANPARIGETIIANLTLTGEGKEPVTDTCEFSVANYLGTLLTAAPSTFTEIKTQEQYVAMRTLAANLVNYSAKTQEYIGLADTSSALLTTETVKNFVGSVEPNGTDATVGALANDAKYGFLGASLLLDGRVSVCFYFVAESTENLSLEIAFEGGSNATLTEIVAAPEIAVKEGVTAYKAVLEGIPAIDMDKKFTAKLLSNGTAVGNEVTYSVKSYAHAMLSSGNAKMKSLATAIYNYGLSAKSYNDVMMEYQQIDTESVGCTIDNSVYTMTAENVTNGWNANTAPLIMNAVQKNGWVYSVRKTYDNKKGYLIRYDYKTNKQVAVSKEVIASDIQVGADGATIFTYGDKVYLYNKKQGKWLSLPLLFNTGDNWDTDSGLPKDIDLGGYATNFENIHVFEDLGLVAVYASGKIVVLKDGVVQATYSVSPADKNRMGGGKNGYLYYTANSDYYYDKDKNPTFNPKVDVINVKNGDRNTILLPNALAKDDNKFAVSGIFELDGKLFYTLFTWNSEMRSCMQSVGFTVEQRLDTPHKGIDEVIAEGGTLTNVKAKAANIGGTVKGVVTDGEYLYMANCTTTGKVKILKTTKDGGILGKTAEIDNGVVASEENAFFNDKTYLLYKDGYVYAYGARLGTKVYRVKASDITADGTCEVKETTELAFKKEDGTTAIAAHAMAYDEKNDRYAIRNGSTLYLVDGKTMQAYKTVSDGVGGTQVGVAADGKYVYALYEKTGGLAFVVYDWSGNKVKDVAVAGFIREEQQVANIPSMVIYGGRAYIFAKPWQGTYGNNVFIYVW